MPSPTGPLSTLGFVLFAFCLVLFLIYWQGRNWKRQVSADFAAALQRLGIVTHEVLLEKITQPSKNNPGEVYRILHTHNEQYFLYLYTPGGPGVLKPLSKERALLAARLNR